MWIVAIAWTYVVLMMSVVEALAPNGTVLGAIVTFFLYGVGPLAVVLYIMGTPTRRWVRKRRESGSGAQPDGGSHAPGDGVAPERKES